MKTLALLKNLHRKTLYYLLVPLILTSFQSCYSVRIASKDATPTGTFSTDGYGYWRDKKLVTIDTTVKVSDFTLFDFCPDGFHTVEYRVSMGHVLLNGITFGKVKKVRIKCNCIKPQN